MPVITLSFYPLSEGLSSLIKRDINSGVLHGVNICRNTPIISHLLCVNDSFFFFRADIREVRAMKHIFSTYEAAFSQSINFVKSGIFFFLVKIRILYCRRLLVLGVCNPLDIGKYLGMTSLISCSKKTVFNFLKTRVWHKIQSLHVRPISKGVKEILIKVVAQAIPIYCMNAFLIHVSIANEI